MTRSIAVENAGKGNYNQQSNLGYFDIGMINDVSEEYQQIVKRKYLQEKFGSPENIYNAVKFIISSDYLNGTSIDVKVNILIYEIFGNHNDI